MEVNKKIKFSADSTELQSSFTQIESKVKNVFSGMVQNARNYSSASKEVVRSIEEQIRALERRNKMEADRQTRGLAAEVSSGSISSRRAQEFTADIAKDKASSKEMVDLLKDLLAITKESAKKEIYHDRQNVERTIIARRNELESLGIKKGNEQEELKQTIQRGHLAKTMEAEYVEGGGWLGKYERGRSAATGIVSTGSGLLATGSDVYMAAALASMLPVVGQGLGQLMGKSIGEAQKLESSMGAFYRMSGKNSPRYWKSSGTDFGGSIDIGNSGISAAVRSQSGGLKGDYEAAEAEYEALLSRRAKGEYIDRKTFSDAIQKKNAAHASYAQHYSKNIRGKGTKDYSGQFGELEKVADTLSGTIGTAGRFAGGILDSMTSGFDKAQATKYLTDMGIQRADVYTRAAQLAGNAGRASTNIGLSSLVLERAFGIGEGMTGGMASLQHAGANGMMEQTNLVVKSLLATGVIQRENGSLKDTSLLNKTIESMLSITQGQVAYTKSASTAGAGVLLSHFQGEGYTPEGAATLTKGLQSGLSRGDNPQLRAMQFLALSKANPGASSYQLRSQFGAIQRGNLDALVKGDYLENFMGILRGASGGNNEFLAENINQALFGGDEKTMGMVYDLVKSGGFNDVKSTINSMEKIKGITGEDFENRAYMSTGRGEASIAQFNEGFAEAGQGLIDATDDLTKNIKKIIAIWGGEENIPTPKPGKTVEGETHENQ